ncbi:hypothetical protein JAAARDRAFT_31655 [Jaapia argillacea MUCL 33604]|uniref:RAM signaling network component n=1 Tax=Jaapia argillacea MUCL 33604 TaxID=933084 RepID=A0A067Q0S4_9AGAM|nr:hypothetical protein JAAARDRAFT_31655 [Jaapia argillacea MUCL 33604]
MSFADSDRALGRTSPYPSSRLPKSSASPSISLTHVHITNALLKSPDNGATLDLSHTGLTDVGESGVEEMAALGEQDQSDGECPVSRITLGHNRLTTLPMAFALLSRLRYLNLKSNNFSAFPDVLTVMTSLEVLDIGRNKIKRLPSQPGSLVHLRVFSISRNKLTRLPSYMTKFHNLNLFQVDHNPIEWPPKDVMEVPTGSDGKQAMKNWVRSVQRWIEDNSASGSSSVLEGRKWSDESIGSTDIRDVNTPIDDIYDTRFRFPIHDDDFDAGVNAVAHSRSFSMDSDTSIYSESEQTQDDSSFLDINIDSPRPSSKSPKGDRLRLHLDSITPSSSYGSRIAPSPSRSPDQYLPTPEDSVAEEDITQKLKNTQPQPQEAKPELPQQHARNASYADGLRPRPLRPPLFTKKSLPDLRTAKVQFGGASSKGKERELEPPSIPPTIPLPPTPASSFARAQGTGHGQIDLTQSPGEFGIPSPVSLRQDSNSSTSDGGGISAKSRVPRPFVHGGGITASPTSIERPAPSMDTERNSYFRRLSTLGTSTISKTIPKSLLTIIDAVRGILFAVSQVYQTLQHYTVFAIDDRMSSVLMKVLDPASAYMTQLINALDRFDSMSRRTLPNPSVCRAVLECCRDTVAVFGKAAGVLALQLKVFATRDDVRYTRQMILVIYGAMAEIGNAWRGMVPHIEACEPLLRDSRPPRVVKSSNGVSNRVPAGLNSRAPSDSGSASAPPNSSMFASSHTPNPLIRTPSGKHSGRTFTSRRHAGSFSSKDVEIGKKLPSYIDVPPLPNGGAGGVTDSPTPRAALPLRQSAYPVLPPSTPMGGTSAVWTGLPLQMQVVAPSPTGDRPRESHSRQISHSSPTSSPAIPPARAPPMLEIPPNSSTLVDRQAINAMKVAVESAPLVWDMMDEILADVQEDKPDLREMLARAKLLTERLGATIRRLEEGDSALDRRALRDDAHIFVKIVVQLSNVIKTYGVGHSVSPSLRSNMVKLTNSTEEFVILLHVSSFSPSSTPRPYSPMVTQSPVALLGTPPSATEERGLGPSLSRSRSAQPSPSSKLALGGGLGGIKDSIPRSALPHHQTFRLPASPRPIFQNREAEVPALPGS